MSLMLNTGAMCYREDGSSGWTPLTLVANVDLASLADEFSTSSTYAVGEYVRRGGIMYRCTTAVTTAGAWNASNWTEVNIGDELENRVLKTGDTMTGNLDLSEGSTVRINTGVDSSSDVGTGESYNGNLFLGTGGDNIGYLRLRSRAEGPYGIAIMTRRPVNDSTIYNNLELIINNDGTRSIGLSDSAIWLNALGLGSTTKVTTASSIVTAASGVSISSAEYAKWGNLATINIVFKKTAAVTSTTSITLGTLASGKRPAMMASAICTNATINYTTISTGGSVIANGTWEANAEKRIISTFVLA